MASFNAAAQLLASSFVLETREDGSTFHKVASSAPDWIRSAVYEAHDGEFPNDSRYALVRDAADALADQLFDNVGDANEAVWEIAGDLTPTTTADLLGWYGAHLSRLHDCDTGIEDSGADKLSIFDLLSLGYRNAAENVLAILIQAVEDNRASIFNPDTDFRLLISDIQGIYIPQLYCQRLTEDDAADYGVEWSDVVCCQSGPEQEWYSEAWQAILDSAQIPDDDDGYWRLHQNGDLWMVRADVELPEGF